MVAGPLNQDMKHYDTYAHAMHLNYLLLLGEQGLSDLVGGAAELDADDALELA